MTLSHTASGLAQAPERPSRLPPAWSAAGFLALAIAAAYVRTFSVPLLFDDPATIADNPSIRHWRTAFWAPFRTTSAGRPVLNLSFAFNYAISGTSVWSYHVLNLLIHILAAWALFGVVRRTLASLPGFGRPEAAAFFAALLWALHPLQTESVTYIAQRAESLMGLFYLLTLYGFIRYAQSGTFPWAVGSVLACLLGMGTKEVMVSAPLIVFLHDRTFFARSFAEAWRRRWKFYSGLAATWLLLPLLVLPTHGRGGTAGFDSGVSWGAYLLTQFPAILRYLKLAVWPHPLVFYYGTEWVRDPWTVLPAAAIVLGLAAASALALGRPSPTARFLGLSGAFFFAILAPSSLVPINRQTAAEHRMYLALIPLVLLTVVGLERRRGRAGRPILLLLASALFLLTFRRNQDYRTALVLWTRTVEDCPGNSYAHGNLACELANLPGRSAEAIAQCREALRLTPDDPGAHNNLGYVLAKIPGREGEAMAEYEEALRLNPDFAEAHNNLGSLLERSAGRLEEAAGEYAEAVRLKPEFAEARLNLARALEKLPGRYAEAIGQYREMARLDPDDFTLHYHLAAMLERLPGRSDEAIAEYRAALRLAPANDAVHNKLGNLFRRAGRLPEAILQYEEAVRLRPDNAEAHNNLGNALSVEGRPAEAIAQYEEALRLKPGNPATHYNLALALLAVPGRSGEAAGQLEATLRLQPENARARRLLERIRSAPP